MSDKCETFVARWDHAMCSTCGAAHAPTPTPAPGLDLDAVDQDFRAAMEGPPGNRSAIKFYHETWPALIAEVRALRVDKEALVKHIDYNPSLRIRECEALRAKLAEVKRLQGQVAETAGYLRAELEPRGRTPSRTGVRELAARLEVIAAALEAL